MSEGNAKKGPQSVWGQVGEPASQNGCPADCLSALPADRLRAQPLLGSALNPLPPPAAPPSSSGSVAVALGPRPACAKGDLGGSAACPRALFAARSPVGDSSRHARLLPPSPPSSRPLRRRPPPSSFSAAVPRVTAPAPPPSLATFAFRRPPPRRGACAPTILRHAFLPPLTRPSPATCGALRHRRDPVWGADLPHHAPRRFGALSFYGSGRRLGLSVARVSAA